MEEILGEDLTCEGHEDLIRNVSFYVQLLGLEDVKRIPVRWVCEFSKSQ